jgi:ribosome-binding factor A
MKSRRGGSFRSHRLKADIQRTLSVLISSEVKDVRVLAASPVLSQIQMSPDFSHVKVYVSMMNPSLKENDIKEVIRILQDCAGFFRSVLGKNLKIRNAPQIHFFYDDFHDQMKEAKELLEQERQELESITGNSLNQRNQNTEE